MSELRQPEAATSETPPFPIARLDLIEEVRRMRSSPMPGGHLGKTLVHGAKLRVVLMVLSRGTQIPAHKATGSLSIQALDGRAIVTLLGSAFDLTAGQLLAIDRGVSHAVVAIEETALLLTIAQ